MAPVWMVIQKFGDAPVKIDSEHPLAVAQLHAQLHAQRALPVDLVDQPAAPIVSPAPQAAPRKRKGG